MSMYLDVSGRVGKAKVYGSKEEVLLDEKIKDLEQKLAETEKELAYYKAIYNPLIDGAARDTMRINELEKKLEIAAEAFSDIYETSDDSGSSKAAKEALKEIEKDEK